MLFFVSKELWQTVRHCNRNSASQDIWRWSLDEEGEGVSIFSQNEKRKLGAVLRDVAETARGPIRIVAASAHLTEAFKRVILELVNQPVELRICVVLTTIFDKRDLESCSEFLNRNPLLRERVSTFFFATRRDSDERLLQENEVAENYRTFLRLLCIGREELARSLGLFRVPIVGDWEEGLPLEECSPFRPTGILAALGVKSWLPQREEIVKRTEAFLATHVVAQEKLAMLENRIREAEAEPEILVEKALFLGMEDEPLSSRHFAGMVPPAPDTPFERWKIPFSIKRARKQTHYLQRTLQQDFAEYTNQLERTLDEIHSRVRRQAANSFTAAAEVYRNQMLHEADIGTLSWLVRDYYPTFGAFDEGSLNDPEEEATGWPPDESLDLFCDVYEVMDDGLDKLPGRKAWITVAYLSMALILAGGVFWEPDGWLPIVLGAVALALPLTVLTYRFFSVRKLLTRLTEISEAVFESLQDGFQLELNAILRRTRAQLESDIRLDGIGLGERIQREFNEIPFVFTGDDSDGEETRKRIRHCRKALIEIGIDESKVDPLPARLDHLARKVIRRATREEIGEVPGETSPKELVDEWVDELVGASELPLEKVEDFYEEIVAAGSSWRVPPLMAPLTDAELHRGFRKAVILPDTDLIYQRLAESLPDASENAAVKVEAWQGNAPGIAVCSVVTGLPDSILILHAKEEEESGPKPVRPKALRMARQLRRAAS